MGTYFGSTLFWDTNAFGACISNKDFYVTEAFWFPFANMWYIMSLITWRLVAPIFNELTDELLIGLPIALAILTNAYTEMDCSGDFLKWNMTWAFFPYYCVGILVRKKYSVHFKTF